MKKRGKITFIFSLILILSVGLISAGWFNDIWNKLTGKSVENLPDLTVSKLDIYREGGNIIIDYCIKNIGSADSGAFFLKFYNLNNPLWDLGGGGFSSLGGSSSSSFPNQEFCGKVSRGVPASSGNGYIIGDNYIELFADSNEEVNESDEANNKKIFNFYISGQEEIIKTKYECEDSDDGSNIFVKGTAKSNAPEPYEKEVTDYCANNTLIQEAICHNDGIIGVTGVECPVNYICNNGVCIKENEYVCGNGIIEPEEECDDGNVNNEDECSSDCRLILDKNFCFQRNFTAAFVLAIVDDINVSINTKKLEDIKPELTKSFSKATNGLATLEIHDEIIVLNYNNYSFDRKFNNIDDIFTFLKDDFYKDDRSKYDFIFVFPNYISQCDITEPGLGWGHYISVQNKIFNIGQPIFDTTEFWGFDKNLKGFTQINSIMCAPENFDYAKTGIRVLLHEMGHQWGMYATKSTDKDNDDKIIGPHKYNETNIYSGYGKLGLLNSDLIHWHGFFIAGPDPMGGIDWKQDGDIFYYTNQLEVTEHNYNPLMLYFMGLLKKKDLVNNTFYILEPTEFVPNFKNSSQAYKGNLREFTTQDIINIDGGEVSCFNITNSNLETSNKAKASEKINLGSKIISFLKKILGIK